MDLWFCNKRQVFSKGIVTISLTITASALQNSVSMRIFRDCISGYESTFMFLIAKREITNNPK